MCLGFFSVSGGGEDSITGKMQELGQKDIAEFAALTEPTCRRKFIAVVERWGMRRSNPTFWQILNSVTDYARRGNPVAAGSSTF